MKLKRGTKVSVTGFEAKIVNAIVDVDNNIIGYRVTDGKRPAFWAIVPLYTIQVQRQNNGN